MWCLRSRSWKGKTSAYLHVRARRLGHISAAQTNTDSGSNSTMNSDRYLILYALIVLALRVAMVFTRGKTRKAAKVSYDTLTFFAPAGIRMGMEKAGLVGKGKQ